MFIIVDDERKMIAVSRGDSAFFDVTFKGDVPEDGTDAIFSVKKDLKGKVLLQKNVKVYDGVAQIDLYSQDTNKLEPDEYYWDVRVLFSEREVSTPVRPSLFKVLEAVGDV